METDNRRRDITQTTSTERKRKYDQYQRRVIEQRMCKYNALSLSVTPTEQILQQTNKQTNNKTRDIVSCLSSAAIPHTSCLSSPRSKLPERCVGAKVAVELVARLHKQLRCYRSSDKSTQNDDERARSTCFCFFLSRN